MLLGAMYVGCLLTNWSIVVPTANITTTTTTTTTVTSAAASALSLITQPTPSVLAVDRSLISTWLKISSSWVVLALYVWTLVAPLVFPDRDFGFER